MTYYFKIQIKGITRPPVWRKIAIPANFTFLKFHRVIQVAFGWDDYHLFEFEDREYESNIRIAIPSEDDFDFGVETLNASKVKLSRVFGGDFHKFLYIYDLGDSWVHEITLESVSNDVQKEVVCLSGKGACPPEDCGGIYGYEEMKRVFQTTPQDDEADSYREWLGLGKDEIWDAGRFSVDEVNARLKHI